MKFRKILKSKMQFKVLALLSLVSIVNACSYRSDKSANWNTNKINCCNAHLGTAIGYRNEGCELFANSYGTPTPGDPVRTNNLLGNYDGPISSNVQRTRAHLFVTTTCANYYLGWQGGYQSHSVVFNKCSYHGGYFGNYGNVVRHKRSVAKRGRSPKPLSSIVSDASGSAAWDIPNFSASFQNFCGYTRTWDCISAAAR